METSTDAPINITRAVFVIDGVDHARASVEAAELLVGTRADWTILAVVREHLKHTSGATGIAGPILTPAEMDQLSLADVMAGDAATAGTARAFGDRPVTQAVVRGTPVSGVRRHLAGHPTDLVVVDSPELAEQLAADGIDPILVIPRAPITSTTGPVLLALDDSPLDNAVIRTAARIFDQSRTGFLAIHVDAARTVSQAVPLATLAPGSIGASMVSAIVDDLGSASAEAARVARAAVAGRDLDDVDAVGEVGDPAAGILRVANEHDASLIVLGTHERGWISRLLRPSVADAVLHEARRPVLLLSSASRDAETGE